MSFHSSLFSFRFPQCVSLRDGLNSRATCRFKPRMKPMRANIVGPPFSATRIRASMTACHSGAECSAFDSFVIWLAASFKVTRDRPRGSGIGSSIEGGPGQCVAQANRVSGVPMRAPSPKRPGAEAGSARAGAVPLRALTSAESTLSGKTRAGAGLLCLTPSSGGVVPPTYKLSAI